MQDDIYRTPEADVVSTVDRGQVQLASRWRRFFGALLDGIILSLLITPFMFTTGYMERTMENTLSPTEPFMWGGIWAFIYGVINGYTLHRRGQTIGKLMVNTQIVSADNYSLLPLWKLILLRWLVIGMLSSIPVIGGFLGLINVLLIFGNDKRCGHDYVAGTVVIDYIAPQHLPRR